MSNRLKKLFQPKLAMLALVFFGFAVYVTANQYNVEITSPSTGDVVRGNVEIHWVDRNGGTSWTISYTTDGSTYYNVISNTTGPSPVTWDTTQVSDSDQYQLKIKNDKGDTYITQGTFTIDNTPPTFNVIDGTESGPVQTDDIIVEVTDNVSGVDANSLEYGLSTDNVCDDTDTYGNSFTSGTAFQIAGDHTDYLCVKAADVAGNVKYHLVGQLNTDNTAPSLVSYTLDRQQDDAYFNPTQDTVDIEITVDEDVKFNRIYVCDINDNTCDDTSAVKWFTQTSSYSTTVQKTWDGRDTSNNVVSDGEYKLKIVIEDQAGNQTTTELTTYTIFVDTVAPQINQINATTVEGGGDEIVIWFTEPVVTADNDWSDCDDVIVESPVGTALTLTNATCNYDSQTNKLTIILDESTDDEYLQNGDSIEVKPISGQIKDYAENEFQTASNSVVIAGDNNSPTVSSISYEVSGVVVNRPVRDADTVTITVEFSEEMDDTPEIQITTQGNGSITWTAMTMGQDRTEWVYSWDVPDGSDDDGTFTVEVKGDDLAGNSMVVYSETPSFEIDNTKPTFTSAVAEDTDANGEIDKITITLSEYIDTNTIDANDFTLSQGSVSSVASASGSQIVLNVSVPTTGSVDVTYTQGTLTDLAGNPADSTTITADDQAAPVITIIVPVNNKAYNTDTLNLEIETSEDADCKYSVDTSINDYSDANASAMSNTGTDNHTQPVSGLSEGTHDVYFVCQDKSTNQNESSVESASFIVDLTTPTTTAVEADTNKFAGQPITITAETFDMLTKIVDAKYEIYVAGESIPVATGSMLPVDGAFDEPIEGLTATVNTSGWNPGSYVVIVLAQDEAGNWELESDDNKDTFTLLPEDSTNPTVTINSEAIDSDTFRLYGTVTDANYKVVRVFRQVGASPDTQTDVLVDTLALGPSESNWEYTVTLPAGVNQATYYVEAHDLAGNSILSATVTLTRGDNSAPTLTSTAPSAKQTVGNVSDVVFVFEDDTAFDSTAKDNIVYLTMNSTDVKSSAQAALSNSDKTLTITYPGSLITSAGIYNFNVKVKDAQGNETEASLTVAVEDPADQQAPTITTSVAATTANSADISVQVDEDSYVLINYGTTDTYGSVTQERILQANTPVIIELQGLACGTTYHYSVTATDAAGNKGYSQDATFTTSACPDTTAPVISKITLDKPAYRKTQDSTVTVTIVEDDTAVTVTVDGNQATEDTNNPGTWTYSFNHSGVVGIYSLTVTATDQAGNSATKTISYSVVEDDSQGPQVISTTPVTGAVGVSVNAGTATILYNEDIQIANQANIDIQDLAGNSVKNGNATVSGAELTIPYSALDYETTYKVVVQAGAVTDIHGNPAAKTEIYFTTQSLVAPSITRFEVTNITDTSADVVWETGSLNVSRVDYRFGEQPYVGTFQTITLSPSTNSGTINLTNLDPGKTYYVTVRFFNGDKFSETVPVAFTTATSNTGVSVDSIQAVKTYAVADDTYANGWKWIFNITVNDMNETNLAMKFSQWVSGTNTIDAGGNMRYSIDDTNWTDITANDTYGADIDISTVDLDPTKGGRQVRVYVEMKVPSNTQPGSYSASYGIRTQ